MHHALKRHMDRLFPLGTATIWQDLRGSSLKTATTPVAIIDLAFITSDLFLPPAPSLLLDMDNGACIEDTIRTGADGILCSCILTQKQLINITRQARKWNYPCIFDCRSMNNEQQKCIHSMGFHGALLQRNNIENTPFKYNIVNIIFK